MSSLPVHLARLILLSFCLVALLPLSVSLAPLGPRTLGILEGFSSTSPYSNPASRADAFGEWLGWRPQFANQALDFSHWSTWPGFFIDPFNYNATDAHITLQMPAMFQSDTTNTTWWDAAAGVYDSEWQQTADVACNVYHKCNIAMRPAWEMNGNWSLRHAHYDDHTMLVFLYLLTADFSYSPACVVQVSVGRS